MDFQCNELGSTLKANTELRFVKSSLERLFEDFDILLSGCITLYVQNNLINYNNNDNACAMLVNDRSGEVHVTSISFYQGKSFTVFLYLCASIFQFSFSMFTSGFENAICKLSCKTIVRMKGKFTRKKHGGARELKKSRAN